MIVDRRPPAPAAASPAAPSPTRAAGRVERIHVAPVAGSPMTALDRVEAIAGIGLAGDRYASKTGHWSPIARRGDRLTLIESEEIDHVRAAWGVSLAPGDTRRNITTSGIRLDDLIGRRFTIGPVVCYAVRRCEPCTYLEGLLGQEVLSPGPPGRHPRRDPGRRDNRSRRSH